MAGAEGEAERRSRMCLPMDGFGQVSALGHGDEQALGYWRLHPSSVPARGTRRATTTAGHDDPSEGHVTRPNEGDSLPRTT